jgi:hypothetical protein
LIGYAPPFEYVAFYNNHQPELHEGFKGYVFRDEKQGIGWYIGVHSETGVISRVCARVHTMNLAAKDLKTGELLLELFYKGDFGATSSNQDDKLLQPQLANCPNQASIANETKAKKRVRVFSGAKDPGGYEQWDGGANRALGMDFPEWGTGMGFDIRNPATGCNDTACSSARTTGESADRRTVEFHDLRISYNNLLDKSDGVAADGFFYTDVYGIVQDDDALNVLRQFVKPGFSVTLDGFYSSQDAWRGLYQEGHGQGGLELEDALGTVN